MTKRDILDIWCKQSKPGLIPSWYRLDRVSKQGDFMFVYYINEWGDEQLYQFRFSDFLNHYRDTRLEELLS